MSLGFYPWESGIDMKWRFLKYKHMNHYITLARDRDPGMVYQDPNSGDPRVRYTPSAFDRSHLLTGQLATARILFMAGAEEIHILTSDVPPFIRRSCLPSTPADSDIKNTDAPIPDFHTKSELEAYAFEKWLSMVRVKGVKVPITAFGNAHQMGTCRMGTSAESSVVDPTGRVWGVKNLWVCDASVLPSATGVNPMVTVMAVADYVAEMVFEEMKSEVGRLSAML